MQPSEVPEPRPPPATSPSLIASAITTTSTLLSLRRKVVYKKSPGTLSLEWIRERILREESTLCPTSDVEGNNNKPGVVVQSYSA